MFLFYYIRGLTYNLIFKVIFYKMFWNKKNKLPITKEDKVWIDEDLTWLRNNFGENHFMEIKTITPTRDFFDRTFDGTEKDAEYILERTKELMCIDNDNITLEFFSYSPVYMENGDILTTPSDTIDGSWESAVGAYQQNDENVIISIETQQLKDPVSLIATIAHELAHEILLGENRIEENDEYLTDLTAITYGFGIFMANSHFNFSSFSTNNGSGWQFSRTGYLPEQIIAYAMAQLSIQRNENISYSKFLKKSVNKYFQKSYSHLIKL